MSEQIEAIYSPTTGRVACVLIQAAARASQSVPVLFNTDDWDTAPKDTMVRMSATLGQWRQLAAMTREERVERWNKRTTLQ